MGNEASQQRKAQLAGIYTQGTGSSAPAMKARPTVAQQQINGVTCFPKVPTIVRPQWAYVGNKVAYRADNGENYLFTIVAVNDVGVSIHLDTDDDTGKIINVNYGDPRLTKASFFTTTSQARIDRDRKRRGPGCTCPRDSECWCELKKPVDAPASYRIETVKEPTPTPTTDIYTTADTIRKEKWHMVREEKEFDIFARPEVCRSMALSDTPTTTVPTDSASESVTITIPERSINGVAIPEQAVVSAPAPMTMDPTPLVPLTLTSTDTDVHMKAV